MLAQVNIDSTFFNGQGNGGLNQLTGVGSLVSRIIQLSFVVAGIILIVLFLMGGIGIIASAGSDNPQGVEKGKQAMTSAIIGFVVVFVAYWIVQLIAAITGTTLL